MTSICREIFKAIHEGKWLSIEYRNREGQITKYWIGIKSLDSHRRSMVVDGLHLGQLKVQELKIFIDSILSAKIIEGSYCEINRQLVDDIKLIPFHLWACNRQALFLYSFYAYDIFEKISQIPSFN